MDVRAVRLRHRDPTRWARWYRRRNASNERVYPPVMGSGLVYYLVLLWRVCCHSTWEATP